MSTIIPLPPREPDLAYAKWLAANGYGWEDLCVRAGVTETVARLYVLGNAARVRRIRSAG